MHGQHCLSSYMPQVECVLPHPTSSRCLAMTWDFRLCLKDDVVFPASLKRPATHPHHHKHYPQLMPE